LFNDAVSSLQHATPNDRMTCE